MMSSFCLFLGLLVGSFLNVLIYRLPRQEGWVMGRSYCPACRHSLKPWHLIPILSFLMLRGRCCFCQAPVSKRYPIIEGLTAVLFYAVYNKMHFQLSPVGLCIDWAWVSLLLVITFIDLEHRIIPNSLNLLVLLLGFCSVFQHPFWPGLSLLESLGGAGLGFGFFYLLSEGYYRFRGREGLGGGDVKLLGALGAFVGPWGVFLTVLISSLGGSLIGLLLTFFQKETPFLRVSLPYGPFLVLGALFYYFFGDRLGGFGHGF